MVRPTFTASDGTQFNDEESARNYEEFLGAKKHFEEEIERFNKAIAKVAITADGEPFDLGRMDSYYRIVWYGCQAPRIIEVRTWHIGVRFCVCGGKYHNNDDLSIIAMDETNMTYEKIPIQTLYSKRENAEKEHNRLLKKYIKTLQERLESNSQCVQQS